MTHSGYSIAARFRPHAYFAVHSANVDAGGEVIGPAAKALSPTAGAARDVARAGLVSREAWEQEANADFATSINVGSAPITRYPGDA